MLEAGTDELPAADITMDISDGGFNMVDLVEMLASGLDESFGAFAADVVVSTLTDALLALSTSVTVDAAKSASENTLMSRVQSPLDFPLALIAQTIFVVIPFLVLTAFPTCFNPCFRIIFPDFGLLLCQTRLS